MEAAENGKEVVALVELRARFDEQNNIDWSKQLESAGCTVIYGFDDYKVHSKLTLSPKRAKRATLISPRSAPATTTKKPVSFTRTTPSLRQTMALARKLPMCSRTLPCRS